MSGESGDDSKVWGPRWAKHVYAFWEHHDEGVYVYMRCTECGDETRVWCPSAVPHGKIQKYALMHMHGAKRSW